MSFWGGFARGLKDSKDRDEKQLDRDEREAARLKAAEYQDKMFKYNSNRDSVLDKRYEDQTRVERERHAATAALAATNRAEDIAYRAGRDKVGDTAAEKTWEMTVDKWDATKDSVKQAQKNADRIFNQSITAFNATTKQYDAQSLRADSAEARAVAAAIYQKERDVIGDTAAATNRDDRIKQWDKSVEQWNKQFGLSEKADARADEAIEIQRTSELLALMPAGMSTSLGGGKVKGASDDTSITPEAMKAGSTAFKAELANMSEDEQSSEFFAAAARSPGAQATIMGFMEAQAKEGNTVELRDMPKYFKYLGSAPGKGEKEAKEFMDSMLSGDANIGDKDTFIKGLTAMKGYRATKEMFIQTSAPVSSTDKAQQLTLWEKAVEMDAFRDVKKLPTEQKAEVQLALSMLETKVDRQEGLDKLAALGYGRTAAESENMMNHPIIGTYYNQDAPAVSVAQPIPASTAPVVADTAPSQPNTPVAEGTVTKFNSWDEVTAARADGFSGVATVGGVSYDIAPLAIEPEVNDGVPTAAMTTAALSDPAAIDDDSGFLGTGETDGRPALPTDTKIDEMFGTSFDAPDFEAMIDEPQATPEALSSIPDEIIEEGVTDIEDVLTGEGSEEEQFAAIIGEFDDMGIEWPTNKEELGYFRDDLKSLVFDYGVEIPDGLMLKIIDKAKTLLGNTTSADEAATEEGYIPPTMGATELNKPSVRRGN